MDAPTFTPSLMVEKGTPRQCHTIITNGMIQFCADCAHELRGRGVPMVDWDTILKEEHMEGEANTQAPAAAEKAAAEIPGNPAPHPGFDRATGHLIMGGFSEETAKDIVNHVGIDAVLAAVTKTTGLPSAKIPAPAAVTAGAGAPAAGEATGQAEQAAVTSSNEPAKQEETPEPGMKRCSTCRIWYPGGYDVCPNDGTRLQ